MNRLSFNRVHRVAAQYGPELVTNGNMEAGNPPDSWESSDGSPVLTRAVDDAGGGTYCLNVAIAVGQTTGTILQHLTLEVGATYLFQAWAKLIDASYFNFYLFTNAWGELVNMGNYTATTWTCYTKIFTVNAAAGFFYITFGGSAGKIGRLDNISVRKIL
jgi:hypothetical protein